MNKVILMGHLGKEPDLKYTPDGKAIASFSLATTKKYKQESKTEWHNITAWEKLAEICSQYLKKGSKILCEGEINYQSWEKDGQKHYKTVITISNMEMLDKKEKDDSPF
ncbi:MAG: Single-stranded DNA-binding protein [bacterium ADurb.Bin157]|jgi:single-strand DNA-binding protein|nr:MAG: Single-stranded DNA-binding protein [bacterium ADurb.Bin157]